MSHDGGGSVEQVGDICRFAWAVGGQAHVCRQGNGHAVPHKCGYCGLEHHPGSDNVH
ncbi:hypothetical protein ACFTSF_21445 [Kribbella sp. NPDC056951]|uniref:Uncharacterized protein n=1 Tax=Kribbella yunnanensis TaxID=190194 RepID=A0ABN2GEC6_9ACTN